MPTRRTYLDYNATAPLRPQARAALVAALDHVGNASSVHAEGRRARATMETAREQVAALAGCLPREIVFTSGGTEANNAVLARGWDTVLLAGIEHDSVLAPARASGARLIELPVLGDGRADLTTLDEVLAREVQGRRRVLVSLQMANNETGVLQPVTEAVEIARRHGANIHTDAVQALGKVPVDFAALGVDFMTLSAHKLGGAKGVGALMVREGARPPPAEGGSERWGLTPLLTGGGQELGQRAGTENVAGIAAFGAATEAVAADLVPLSARLNEYQDQIETGVFQLLEQAQIAGSQARRLPNTSCIVVPGMSAETLVIALDLEGIAVSAGAAWSSGKVKTSHVLSAMGLPPDIASSAIRVSTGWNTTQDDIDAFLAAFGKVIHSRRPARRVA